MLSPHELNDRLRVTYVLDVVAIDLSAYVVGD